MKSQLKPFEDYVLSLVNLGVFPKFERSYNGWTCVLRNSANTQIMPSDQDFCWAETMIDALTLAVEGLNNRFENPKDLQKYINTGIEQNIESLLESIESLHRIKAPSHENTADNLNNKANNKAISADFIH